VRHGVTSLFAALNVATGVVIHKTQRRQRAIEFKKFLVTIDKAVPQELDVYLVLANASTHRTPEIHRWLLRHPRFHLHFAPTSGSWLNLVERWFAELTNRWLRRGTHRSVRALEASLKEWAEAWNENPRPYVWHKTAAEIPETLGAYCQRISDSRD
jgi:transposase